MNRKQTSTIAPARRVLILKYLKSKSRSRMTTDQIATGINKECTNKGYKTRYTNKQVVECLSRLATNDVITKFPQAGTCKMLWKYGKTA